MEAHTVYCESLNCRSVKKANLTRVDVNVELDKSKLEVPMLIDSGATASFININKLCPKIADKISKFVNGQNTKNEFGLKRIDLTIKSALNYESVNCAIGKVKLSIKSWKGEHDFIFTDITEKAILGMDFSRSIDRVNDPSQCWRYRS